MGNITIIAFPKNSNACGILHHVQRHQLRFCRSFSSASLVFFVFDLFRLLWINRYLLIVFSLTLQGAVRSTPVSASI